MNIQININFVSTHFFNEYLVHNVWLINNNLYIVFGYYYKINKDGKDNMFSYILCFENIKFTLKIFKNKFILCISSNQLYFYFIYIFIK